jgi:hypothetical protein
MTRLEKCELLKLKGYTYDPETGKIYGTYGKEITNKYRGYISLTTNLTGHHFGWYWVYGNVDFEMLDHINRNKSDNRISNLRSVTNQQNSFNNNSNGYYLNKKTNKYLSQIRINNKSIYLGSFLTEEEARQAYLIAKEKYHTIPCQI